MSDHRLYQADQGQRLQLVPDGHIGLPILSADIDLWQIYQY